MAESRSAAHLAPPPAVLRIVERLEKAGHEAWCVGGAVRDALMGHAHLDWDIATSAKPAQVRRAFPRTVPVGIEFGTVGVLDQSGVLHEVTTFRRDVRTDGRHAEVEFGVSLDDDLARRDFTINAIAFSPTRNELRDPYGGQRDLGLRLVRAVGEPAARMKEDRLRALRGIRFAARFGFTLEPATWKAMVESAQYLGRLSAERVKQEIEKTMEQVERPSTAFRLWRDSGAFGSLVPSLASSTDAQLAVVDCLPKPELPTRPARRLLRVAALFAAVPDESARNTLRALRFSNNDANAVARLLEGSERLRREMTKALMGGDVSDGAVRRWVASVGRTQWSGVLRLLNAAWCEERARGGDAPSPAQVHSLYKRGIRTAFRDAIAIADLAVDGDDLRAAGVPAGPAIGKTLQRLLDAVLDDPSLNRRDALIARALEQ